MRTTKTNVSLVFKCVLRSALFDERNNNQNSICLMMICPAIAIFRPVSSHPLLFVQASLHRMHFVHNAFEFSMP